MTEIYLRSTSLFRSAAVIFVLFAAGHTVGFLGFRPPDAAGLAVYDAMNRVHFQVGRATFSYGNFYRGFGLSITATNLFLAALCWWLGGVARRHPEEVAPIGWSLVALQVAGLALSLLYFSAGPAVLSGVVIVCLALATLRAGSRSD